jgi:hypothetical protein
LQHQSCEQGAGNSNVRQHLGPHRYARDTLQAHRRVARDDDYDYDQYDEHWPRREYSQRQGRQYDSEEDWSRSVTPDPQLPRSFFQKVHNAQFLSQFQGPTTVPKYNRETNPSVRLEDYQLACHVGGAKDDLFIIKNLPLHLANSTRTWLEHLPRGRSTAGRNSVKPSWATSRAPTRDQESSSQSRVTATASCASPSPVPNSPT